MFADLAGFTALTEARGDDHALAVVDDFCRHVDALLDRHGGDRVKGIGDAFMLRVPDPTAAVRIGLDLARHEMDQPAHLLVRVGMHHGPAVERDGDWFGATVNISARVAAVARSGEVLLTGPVRDAAGTLDEVEFRDHGEHRLRGVSAPVRLWLAECPHDEQAPVVDPVCGVRVDARHAVRLEAPGGTVLFCSEGCRHAFDARNPAVEPDRA